MVNESTRSPYEGQPTVQVAGADSASAGTVVAIVVVVGLIACVIGSVCWAKNNQKFCFRPESRPRDPEVVVDGKEDDGLDKEDLETGVMLNKLELSPKPPSTPGSSSEDHKPEADKGIK